MSLTVVAGNETWAHVEVDAIGKIGLFMVVFWKSIKLTLGTKKESALKKKPW